MTEILLIDGAKYKSLVFNKEDEFEEIVKNIQRKSSEMILYTST